MGNLLMEQKDKYGVCIIAASEHGLILAVGAPNYNKKLKGSCMGHME